MLGGANLREIVFVALLVGVVLVAPYLPRLGEAIASIVGERGRK